MTMLTAVCLNEKWISVQSASTCNVCERTHGPGPIKDANASSRDGAKEVVSTYGFRISA